jgi:hypothetical protein
MKAINGKFVIEGTPQEMKEFFQPSVKTEKLNTEKVYVVRKTSRKRLANNRTSWTKQDDEFILANWHNPDSKGDKSKYLYNKGIARKMGRTYDACCARVWKLKQ